MRASATITTAMLAGMLLAVSRGLGQPGPPMPGDRLVRRAHGRRTMQARMPAPPQAVWPWLAQMGAGRAGWYSIDLIDNGGRPSAREVISTLQRISPGDALEASALGGPPFIVTEVREPGVLVTTLRARRGWLRVSYAYVLEPDGGGGTWLHARLRVGGRPAPVAMVLAPLVIAGHEVGQRVQFARLRRRVSGR